MKKQIRVEQELTSLYLKDIPHAFFTTSRNNDIILEKGQQFFLGLKVNVLSEQTMRQCVSLNSKADLERFYLTLNVIGIHNVTLQIQFKEQEAHWYELRYQVAPAPKGHQLRAMGLLINVDQNILNNQQREILENQEKEAQIKECFLQNMSTEIRSPLNIIFGFSELMCNPDFELSAEERAEYSKIIYSNSRTLMTLVKKIMDISKIDSGSQKFSMKDYTLEELLNSIQFLWLQQMPAGVQFRYLEGRKGIHVMADKSRTEQILTEFLSHAVNHTTTGEILLGWTYNLESSQVEIFVEDTSDGQAETNLTVPQVIAKSMNYDITMQKKPGKGCKFALIIPEITENKE